MNRIVMLAVVMLCVFACFASAIDRDKKVIVTGYGDNTAKGREDAKNDALRKAIEKAVGTYVSAEMLVENREVVEERIFSQNNAYIKSVNTLSEGVNADGLWAVKIEASVAEGKIRDDLKAFKILSRKKGNPRLMVIVKATERDKHWYSNPEANSVRAKIENRLLRKKFRLVDINQVKNIAAIEKAAAAGDAAQLKALAQRYGAEMIITCDVMKNLTDSRTLYGRKVDFYSMEIALKAVVADTAQMIYSDAVGDPRIGGANLTGLYNKVTGLTQEMIEGIMEAWQEDVYNEAIFELNVVNSDYQDLLLFKEALMYSLGVNDVIERSFAENMGYLEIMFAGSADQLGMLLADLEEPSVKLLSRSATKFKIQIVKEAAPVVIQDTTPPKVKITSPANGALFGKTASECTVTGTVDDAAVSQITLNGSAVAVTNGAFQAVLALKPGANPISAAAVDAAGNTGTDAVTVTLDNKPPFLKFKVLNFEQKTFEGQVEPGSVLTVNNQKVPVDKNGFFKIVLQSVEEGELTFLVVDAAGNKKERVYDY